MPPLPVTVPVELEPSPQLHVTVKSETGAPVFASVKVNAAFTGVTPSTPVLRVRVPAVSTASATCAIEVAVAVLVGVSTSLTVTVIVYVPSSAYVWVPLTVNGPPVGPLTVPTEGGVVSPQSIVAVYSPAVALVSGSVNVATVPLNDAPSVALIVVPEAVMGTSQAENRKAPMRVAQKPPAAMY